MHQRRALCNTVMRGFFGRMTSYPSEPRRRVRPSSIRHDVQPHVAFARFFLANSVSIFFHDQLDAVILTGEASWSSATIPPVVRSLPAHSPGIQWLQPNPEQHPALTVPNTLHFTAPARETFRAPRSDRSAERSAPLCARQLHAC